MHDVVLYTRSFVGDETVEHGTEGSCLLVDWLELNGTHVVEHRVGGEAGLKVELGFEVPGFLTLTIHDPLPEVRALFTPESWEGSTDEEKLVLLVSSVRLEPSRVPA